MKVLIFPLFILIQLCFASSSGLADKQTSAEVSADVVIYGATPSGISAALQAARMGSTVLLFDRNSHIGGLVANGLGATDIKNRAAIAGIFLEFVTNVRMHYRDTYGEDSQQLKDCNSGYYFEPHVAEMIFERMLSEQPNIQVFKLAQLSSVKKTRGKLATVSFSSREGAGAWTASGRFFIDATYEGDLAAMAGVPYRTGRESRREFGEPYAGVLYMGYWNKKYYEDLSTGEGDDRIQAYNYRLCLTDVPQNLVKIEMPEGYDRSEYAILGRQVRLGQVKNFEEAVSIIRMPNGKSDTNNHTIPLISTDLPEENYPYPEADWEWRDKFAARLRNYILGFLYYCQNDSMLPEAFRAEALKWGLAKDEYTDNGHFPRQVYVREARRINGVYNFKAQDCMVLPGENRTRIQPDSIACGSYEIDSHPTRKYEPGYPAMEGLLGIWQHRYEYQVPYGVIVPEKGPDNLLVTAAISGTHLGFSTLRMEPCWMAMGQAGGAAAHIAINDKVSAKRVNIEKLQRQLLKDNAVIMMFNDLEPDTVGRAAIQFFGSKDNQLNTYNAYPRQAVDRATGALYLDLIRRLGYWGRGASGKGIEFSDVPKGHPSFKAIGALTARGVFKKEVAEGEFRPYESLTPEQLTRWLEEAGIQADMSWLAGRNLIRRGEFLNFLYNLPGREQ